ncbi:hypothetical protein RGQ29_029417 [Quercus rubra]|uniref:Uncharacterized protein n=1 Tax=Quercus rubra TaxID=3512 RepID=A0AAN7IN83_QUERU|nr:hypothetical protein RGQ29_029417 [Quercus rubra]
MHSLNKREESKKGKCIEESTSKSNDSKLLCGQPKSNDFKLVCGQPNSLEQIGFEVAPGVSSDKQSYNLDSSLHGNHHILRYNHQERSFLNHMKYNFTVEEWLVQNPNNWCRMWNVDQPTEEAMKLIQCLLKAVRDWHSERSVHGFLHHPENFFIKFNQEKITHVHLAHKNMEPKTSARIEVYQNDILAISDMIFNQILGSRTRKKYPKDLEDLQRWLSPDMRFEDWTIIVDHPSLWHWKIRFTYIERVWMQYLHADKILKERMDYCLRRIPCDGWINKIPSGTPLERMFKNNSYRPTPHELLRYIRIVRFHYKDHRIDPQTEADYLEERFIEHKTTQVCEILLVYLHRMVCKLRIEV